MFEITSVTFTGVDDSISHHEILRLPYRITKYLPDSNIGQETLCELGILYYKKKAGSSKYPSPEHILDLIKEGDLPISLHICGVDEINSVMKAEYASNPILGAILSNSYWNVNAIQLNFHRFFESGNYFVGDLLKFLDKMADKGMKVILPYNPGNAAVFEVVKYYRNVVPLVDSSGGKGIHPTTWPKPPEGFDSVRFAGGITEENVLQTINKIYEDTGCTRFGIDMESSLRTAEDTFDLDKCSRIIDMI